MPERSTTRPCWVVLTPGTPSRLEAEIARIGSDGRRQDDQEPSWEIRMGNRGHLAVIEYAPASEGSDDEKTLAEALSRKASSPTYVLWLSDDDPRVQVFEKGSYVGDARAWPDDVAAHLGCSFPEMSASARAPDLTPHKAPAVVPGEMKIARLTVRQWQHEIETALDWDVLLDASSEQSVNEVIAALSHPDAAVRAVACRLTEALGVDALGSRAKPVLRRLREIAAGDPDPTVRAVSREAGNVLAEFVERDG